MRKGLLSLSVIETFFSFLVNAGDRLRLGLWRGSVVLFPETCFTVEFFPMTTPAPMLVLTEKPILKRSQERKLFAQRDQFRAMLIELQQQSLKKAKQNSLAKKIHSIQNEIIEANQRLLYSIAKQFAGSLFALDELICMGEFPLMRSVELFDVSRGYCFSTYATNALRNFFSRQIQRESRRQQKTTSLKRTDCRKNSRTENRQSTTRAISLCDIVAKVSFLPRKNYY